MKGSVLVAVASVGMMVTARIVMGALALLSGQVSPVSLILPIGVALLILIGILKGQRLAWQWGRMLGLLGAIILTLAAASASTEVAEEPAMLVVVILLGLQGIPLFPMFFALGTRGAKEHFRVICPDCGGSKVKGGDFLFTKAICRECNATWS